MRHRDGVHRAAAKTTQEGSKLMSANENPDDFLAEIEKHIEEERRKEHPDYRNTVYCDKHLGVKMRLATSWGSHEYGDTWADINPNLLWYCPKPDCDRHYEPTMFGYHINEPGRRLQTGACQRL